MSGASESRDRGQSIDPMIEFSQTHGTPTERGIKQTRGYKYLAPPERNQLRCSDVALCIRMATKLQQ